MQTWREGEAAPDARITVAVIYGGRNSEHDVSCSSAASVLRNLDPARYDATPIRITRDGRWLIGVEPHAVVAEPAVSGASTMVGIVAALGLLRSMDVAFPCVHGPFGEDGTLQSLLELAGIPYVGSGVLSSATAMDKEFTKKIAAAEGIAVAEGVVLRDGEDEVTPADRERLGLPVFVKPARGGSSVGVSRVDDWECMPAALETARQWDTKVLVEAAVFGREVDVGLLQRADGTIEAAPPLEIVVKAADSFFDYSAKYLPGGAEFVIPADLPPDQTALLADAARRVFDALGCGGLLRVDFFLTEPESVAAGAAAKSGPSGAAAGSGASGAAAGSGASGAAAGSGASGAAAGSGASGAAAGFEPESETAEAAAGFESRSGRRVVPVLNEVNTMPGLTEMSQFPQMWATTGMSYAALLDRLLTTALAGAGHAIPALHA